MRKYGFPGAALFMAIALLVMVYLGYIGGQTFAVQAARQGMPSSPRPPIAALFLSGDMGFSAGLGPRISERLAHEGMTVVEENSLVFFRSRRDAPETGAMIAAGLRRALAARPGARLVLLGQSYGADMIAPAFPYIPKALRDRIILVGLIVPGATREWRASPSEIFSFWEHEEDALPAARRLTSVPLLCINGAEESAGLCPHLHAPNQRAVTMPGGHELNWNADGVAHVLIDNIDRIHPSA